MTLDDITTIGIVGAGQMGRGISQVCATAGYHVLLVDVADPPLKVSIPTSISIPRWPIS